MKKECFTVTKLTNTMYRNKTQETYDDAIYCEIQYQRDRSSFAGIALNITDENGVVVIRECEEKIIKDVNEYEKLYIGCEPSYIDSIKEIFFSEKRSYGIEVFFLVYSDVRSSQIIFEELMKNILLSALVITRQTI